jgi:tripeptidyl-peptidase-1
MINARRLDASKSGFLGPTPYSNLQVLIDVTIGSNQGCGTKGFTAVPGWDWVTGLRTQFSGHAGVVYGVALGVFLGVGF